MEFLPLGAKNRLMGRSPSESRPKCRSRNAACHDGEIYNADLNLTVILGQNVKMRRAVITEIHGDFPAPCRVQRRHYQSSATKYRLEIILCQVNRVRNYP